MGPGSTGSKAATEYISEHSNQIRCRLGIAGSTNTATMPFKTTLTRIGIQGEADLRVGRLKHIQDLIGDQNSAASPSISDRSANNSALIHSQLHTQVAETNSQR